MNMQEACAHATLTGGLIAFLALNSRSGPYANVLQNSAVMSYPDLITFATYATTYFGVSSSQLSLITGGDPESNRIWPEEPVSFEKNMQIWSFLSRELMKKFTELQGNLPQQLIRGAD